MRRIVLAIAGTISGLVIVLSYPTSLNRNTAATAALASGGAAATQSGSSSTGSPAGGTSSGGSTTTAPVTTTYTGATVRTQFGPVQVQITVTDGSLTDAVATRYPSQDRRSMQISSYAVPTLESETVSAKSASIHLVSGATYTSRGYVQSLQSALDQAQL
jgi:uncharacterized protein with FMN-binding domain